MRGRRVSQWISARAFGDNSAGTQRVKKTPALQDHLFRRVGVMDVIRPRNGRGSVRKPID